MSKPLKHVYWTAAATFFEQEERAASHVERQGFEYYLPKMKKLLKHGKEKRELMFPGYLFIRVTAQWRSLMSTRGIQRLSTCGEQPSRMPDREINALRDMEDDHGFVCLLPRLKDNSSVELIDEDGSRLGVKGIYLGMTAQQRCIVALSILGQATKMSFDRRVLTEA